MEKMFAGKAALVTGGASGMGRAAAVAFAREGCGVIVTTDRNRAGVEETVRLIKQAGGEAEFVMGSVSCQADAERFVAAAVEKWGRLDFAFNNAGCGADGVHIPFVPLTEVTEGDWDKVIDTNLKGVFHCLKYELIQMQKQGSGAIVNTSSIGGLEMAPRFGAYGPSKAGVIAITQTAAVENAKAGIRVNAICPGPTEGTNLMADSVATGSQDPEFLKEHIIPMGKLGTTQDVADSVVYLCSNMAGHVTGMALSVCGGMQM